MSNIVVKIVESPVATGIFLATIATSLAAFQNESLKEKFILRPYAFTHRKQYHTVITSGLIHADWNHLLMNMFTFFFFAFRLEHYFTYLQCERVGEEVVDVSSQRLSMILGHTKFFLIYFISMILADLTTIVKYKDIPSYGCLGASGAISGLVMSTVILAPAMSDSIMIWGLIPGWVFAILYLSYSYYAARKMMDNVAHEAHLWGAIAGIVFTAILMPKESWQFVEMLKETFYGWMG
jgi:membrane associated rhomboid family serine protease